VPTVASPGGASESPADRCRVLVVDDEADVRLGLKLLAESLDTDVRAAGTAEEALLIFERWTPHLVVSDITMPGLSGLDLLDEVKRRNAGVRVVLITGFGTIEMAVSAMHRGAAHFITKPFDNDDVLEAIRSFGRQAMLEAQIQEGRARAAARGHVELISEDPHMAPVFAKVAHVAPTGMSVLIQGESGVGKELVARALHKQSRVAARPFLALNAAALPDTLLESELFGHARGAFTGAVRDRKGIFEQVAGGTVFLDEVGLMSMPFQAKLLRVLQEKQVTPLGGSRTVPVDFRLVTATAQPLHQRMREGAFREDLYYRLNVVTVEVPPLRARPLDIALLASHFVSKYVDEVPALRTCPITFTASALAALRAHAWPGNVRELENCIQRALVAAADGEIRPEHLGLGEPSAGSAVEPGLSYEDAKQLAVRDFQRVYVERALREAQGNITQAARACGMTRAALQRILRALDIDRETFA